MTGATSRTDLDNLVEGFKTKLNTMKDANNERSVDEEPKKANQEVFKEAIRKFSTTRQPLLQQQQSQNLAPKFGRKLTKDDSAVPEVAKSERISLNDEGKEEFCLTFDKVGQVFLRNIFIVLYTLYKLQ